MSKYEFYGRFHLDGEWMQRERVILAFCCLTSLNGKSAAYGWLEWTLFQRLQIASEITLNIWPIVSRNVAWSLPTLQGQRNPWLAVDQQVVSVLFSLQFPPWPVPKNLGQHLRARHQVFVPNVTRSPDVDWRQNVPTWLIRNKRLFQTLQGGSWRWQPHKKFWKVDLGKHQAWDYRYRWKDRSDYGRVGTQRWAH